MNSIESVVTKYPEQRSAARKQGKIVSHGTRSRYSGLHSAYFGVHHVGDFRTLDEAKAALDEICS